MDSHHSSAGEVENTTDDSTNDEKPSTAKAVDERQDDAGCHEEDDILDDGGCQSNVTSLFVRLVRVLIQVSTSLTIPAMLKMYTR